MSESSAPLDSSQLPRLAGRMAVPEYDRSALRRSIVHIGVGGFHRAHLATYVDELCRSGNCDWAIVGCGVLAGDRPMAEALGAQDMLYTLITRGAHTTEVQVLGSIVEYVLGSPDPEPVVDRIARPETQIVSLTVTEGGYPVDDVTCVYLPDSPNAGPGSAFALVATALERRRTNGAGPITVMSCDNIMANGRVARTATLGAATRFGPELLDWIGSQVSFPNSMVDRITPVTTDADRAWLADQHDIVDRWPVVTEPFRQWVIEDDFAGDRLPLEQLDVIATDDVEPYELMKLRLLNAAHSCLAYLAALDGIVTVDAAMARPDLASYVRAFLELESAPVLPPVHGIDVAEYNRTLVDRFSNPAIGDQIARLCLDGSAKFPKFLLPTVRAQLAVGGSVELSTLALAGWCEYLGGFDSLGNVITPASDPKLAEATARAERAKAHPATFLEFAAVFGDDLADADRFRAAFVDALHHLRRHGVAAAIERAIAAVDDGLP